VRQGNVSPLVVWRNWNTRVDTAPVSGDRATLAGSRSLRALRKPSMAGPTCAMLAWPRHGAALALPLLALYAPLLLAPMSALGFSPSCRYQTPPLSHFFSRRRVARTSPCCTNAIPSFLLFPTRTSLGSVPWRCCSPPRVPAGDPPPRRLRFRCVAPPPPSTGL
jgi:hypothetical protein